MQETSDHEVYIIESDQLVILQDNINQEDSLRIALKQDPIASVEDSQIFQQDAEEIPNLINTKIMDYNIISSQLLNAHTYGKDHPGLIFYQTGVQPKARRKIRVTPQQCNIMVDFMGKHLGLARGTISGPGGRAKITELWNRLSVKLNSTEFGPTKNAWQWQKCWTDLKSSTKIKAAKIARSQTESGIEVPSVQSLTEFEKRMLRVITTGDEPEENSEDNDDNSIAEWDSTFIQCCPVEANVVSEEVIQTTSSANKPTPKKRKKPNPVTKSIPGKMAKGPETLEERRLQLDIEKLEIDRKKVDTMQGFLELGRMIAPALIDFLKK